jgi:signal transduction histidine kinase
LSVHDNGRGITPAAMTSSDSLGLLGMKERAALLGGEMLFERRPEGGTIVTVRIAQTEAPAHSQELYDSRPHRG